MGYYLPINKVYWGYNPFTNHLLTSWDIQVGVIFFMTERTRHVALRLSGHSKRCMADPVLLAAVAYGG